MVEDSNPQHIDYMVYTVVQELRSQRGCVGDDTEFTIVMAISIIAGFSLDSFNYRSGSPEQVFVAG
jgi:hypothetical protein